MLNPVERWAALRLLAHAINAAAREAQADADEFRKATRAKQLETDHGLVFVARSKPTVVISDEAAFLAWCEEHAPLAVERRVADSARKTLLASRFKADDDGSVYDADTGEQIDFADVRPGGVESLSFRADPAEKARAEALIADRVEQLAEFLPRREVEQ